MTDLGTLTNGTNSDALAINNNGQVVGSSEVIYPSSHPLSNPNYPNGSFRHAFISEKIGDSWIMKDLHPETVYRYPEENVYGLEENVYGLNESYAVDINDSTQTLIIRGTSSIEYDITIAHKSDTEWSFITLEDAFDTSSPIHLIDNPVINNSGLIAFSYHDEAGTESGTTISYSNNSWQRTDFKYPRKINLTFQENSIL